MKEEFEVKRKFDAGDFTDEKMTYMQLVEEINKDIKALEYQNRPLALY